jgi:hypothetical protein
MVVALKPSAHHQLLLLVQNETANGKGGLENRTLSRCTQETCQKLCD